MQNNSMEIKVDHVSIQTADFKKAFDFYTKILGLGVIKWPFDFKGSRTLAWLDAGRIQIELYSVKKGKEPQAYDDRRVGLDHVAFEVKNLDLAITHFAENHVKILKQPFKPTDAPDQPRIAFIEGPDAEEIEIRERLS